MNAVVALIDADAGSSLAPYIVLGYGSVPVTIEEANSNILATLMWDSFYSFGAAAGGSAASTSIGSYVFPADQTEVPTYFRVYNGSGSAAHLQGTIGDVTDAPVDLQVNHKYWLQDGEITITPITLTFPE